jgi:hypothetical protein
MTPNEKPEPVPEWLVERLAAGELPPARADEVRRRLARETDGAARLARIATSNDELIAAHAPAMIADEVRRRLNAASKPARTPRQWGVAFGVPTLALAALGLALWLRPTGHATLDGATGADTAEQSERLKGLRPALRVYRQAGEKVERLREGAVMHAGERLQLAYVAAGHRFGAVLSVDGTGQVTFHLPAAGPAVERLRPDGEVALPEAFELDAAPGFERFVLIVGDASFDAATLADVARGVAAPPAGTVATSFTVRKESL